MADAQIQLYKYTNTQLQHIYNCWQYISNTNIYIGEYMYKFNLYIGIGYILPTIVRYMSIGGCTYAYIRPPTDIYPPIVSSICPKPIHKFNWHIFPNCWQYISNIQINIQMYILENANSPNLRPKAAQTLVVKTSSKTASERLQLVPGNPRFIL